MQILATLCYVRDDEGRTLMLHRVKKPNDMHEGKWNGLGGKLEMGESAAECAIREIHEESGLVVEDPVLRGFICFPNFDGANDWHVFVYRFDTSKGELIDSPEGNLAWLSAQEIEQVPLWEGDRIFMPWLDESRIFTAVFRYTAGKLVSWDVSWH